MNKPMQLSCVARGEGFIPVDQATFFNHNEPVHTGLFQEIGGSLQPVQNTDTSVRIRTCVKRDGLFRAIEDMDPPAGPETRYIGLFTSYEPGHERHPSMPYYPPVAPAFTSVRHFEETGKRPDFYKGAASRRGFKSIVTNAN